VVAADANDQFVIELLNEGSPEELQVQEVQEAQAQAEGEQLMK